MKKIYVGNLAHATTDATLKSTFEQFGEVISVRIMFDRETGRSRGFGFVEMANEAEADAAIDGLNGKELDGRALRVNEAQAVPAGGRPGGFGGGDRGPSRGPRTGGNGGGGFRSRF